MLFFQVSIDITGFKICFVNITIGIGRAFLSEVQRWMSVETLFVSYHIYEAVLNFRTQCRDDDRRN